MKPQHLLDDAAERRVGSWVAACHHCTNCEPDDVGTRCWTDGFAEWECAARRRRDGLAFGWPGHEGSGNGPREYLYVTIASEYDRGHDACRTVPNRGKPSTSRRCG